MPGYVPRIGIAGFLHESNTFVPAATTYEDFAVTSLTRGAALVERWREASHELGGFLAGCQEHGLEAAPMYATFAVPSGTIAKDAYERIATELIDALRDQRIDGLLVALHGATVAEGALDADGELLRRIRAATSAPVVITFDLHANLSQRMIQHAAAAIGYQSNPHLDQRERGIEAAGVMARILRDGLRPVSWLEQPPMLIANSRQYTSEPPARLLYDDMRDVRSWPGVVSASVAMGFPHADVEEAGASFLAVALDQETARRAARWMARRAWERRAEFRSALPSPEDAVRCAASAAGRPVVILDTGDNVGGGAAGNSTVLLDELNKQGIDNGLIVLVDPEGVRACVQAGVRAQWGAGTIRTISDGIFEETQPRHGGWTRCDQGVTAVIETPQRHTIVLTSRRMAPFSLEQLLSLGIHPERKRVLIVKGVVAPRAAYEPVAAEFVLAGTPGETADDPRQLPYRHRRHPLYPLEEDAQY